MCQKHPKYRAILPPRAECKVCWQQFTAGILEERNALRNMNHTLGQELIEAEARVDAETARAEHWRRLYQILARNPLSNDPGPVHLVEDVQDDRKSDDDQEGVSVPGLA